MVAMHYPKDIEIWEHAPSRKLAEIVVRIKNEKGALAKLSKAISRADVNMLTGSFTAPSGSSLATLSFFADVTDAPKGLPGLKRYLGALDVVESVDATAAEDGFMVDRKHFPVRWAGRRAVVIRAHALNGMLERLWTVFGTGAVTIIDQMAEAMGRSLAEEIIEDLGSDFVADNLDELIGAYSALGYADVSIQRSRSANFPIVVNAAELFECGANAKQGVRQKSAFFRAHLRGFMSAIFEKEFDVSEAQCVTEGDEVCSFRIAPPELEESGVATMVPRHSRQDSFQSKL
jgi:predicted hydrocarbon binding protein